MFANTKFTKKSASIFINAAEYEGDERLAYTCMRPYIFNDSDNPPKTLITLDFFSVPVEDVQSRKFLKNDYDIDGYIALLPEDAIKLVRNINMLISEVFNEMNYVKR